jgi:hypothetical protein
VPFDRVGAAARGWQEASDPTPDHDHAPFPSCPSRWEASRSRQLPSAYNAITGNLLFHRGLHLGKLPALPDYLRSSASGTGSTQPREYN